MVLDLAKHGERLSNEAGMRDYLNLMVKAQAIKMVDSVRGVRRTSSRAGGEAMMITAPEIVTFCW